VRERRALLVLAVAIVLAAIAIEPAAPQRASDPTVRITRLLGVSDGRRPISVFVRGDPDSPAKELVVGCIHGNEPAGIAIADRLESLSPARDTGLWIVPDANPDGIAADTRTNADGVDLNRNFPWRWRRRGRVGDPHFSGPRALSEPESRLLAALIERLRPRVTIWFHQPFTVVDASGGNRRVEKRYASLVGLPLRRLPRYPGGATDWQNARFPHTTAFVVELPPHQLSPRAVLRYARAATALLRPTAALAG
jgi:protein MpaA